eukprot:gnl/Chilomastix_cuspidata/1050.p1 GENE.gnl/Chilomastix_cuspidata/1050~~gnl/Chilomastix_cuspidata/1050.p1  ORF type:complete len:1023 (-),score=139.88 gnl/Chilomastix_cuspidata/1050:3387-6455(-)
MWPMRRRAHQRRLVRFDFGGIYFRRGRIWSDEAAMTDSLTEEMEQLFSRVRDIASTIPSRAGSPTTSEDSHDDLMRHSQLMGEGVSEDDFLEMSTVARQPKCLVGGIMRGYQLEGLEWLSRLYSRDIGGVLADQMGLGKTIQSISLLAWVRENYEIHGPHIIVAPKSTLPNWKQEFEKWLPSANVLVLVGEKEERAEMIRRQLFEASVDIVLTSYAIARIERTALQKIKFDTMIIDEAHVLKNSDAQITRVLRKFSTDHKFLLTGTPLQNNLGELWSLLNFLMPTIFTSSEEFARILTHATDGQDAAEVTDDSDKDHQSNMGKAMKRLHKILSPFMLRREKKDVESLPPRNDMLVACPLTQLQRRLYRAILGKSPETFSGIVEEASDTVATTSRKRTRSVSRMLGLSQKQKKPQKRTRLRLNNILSELRKSCNHPYLFEGVEEGPPFVEGEHLINASGKLMVLDVLLKQMHEANKHLAPGEKPHKALIFSLSVRTLIILDDYCHLRGWGRCRLDGSTPMEKRAESIRAFNRPTTSRTVFLISTRAGGLGINLTAADTVVLYDIDFNPQVDAQAVDRAHRIGQTRPVNIYRLISAGSVEEKIFERARMKLHLDELVVTQGVASSALEKKRSSDDLLSLVSHGAKRIAFEESTDITPEHIEELICQAGEEFARLEENAKDHSKDAAKTLLSKLKLDGSIETDPSMMYKFEGKDFAKSAVARELDGLVRSSVVHNDSVHFFGSTQQDRFMPRAARRPPGPPRIPLAPKKRPPTDTFQKTPLFRDWWCFLSARQSELQGRIRAAWTPTAKASDRPLPGLNAGETAEFLTYLSRDPVARWRPSKRVFVQIVNAVVSAQSYDPQTVVERLRAQDPHTELDLPALAAMLEDFEGKLFAAGEKGGAYIKRITRARERRERQNKNDRILAEAVAGRPHPNLTAKIVHGGSSKYYSEGADRVLVALAAEHGQDASQKLAEEIRGRTPVLRPAMFDWYMRTRTGDELKRRVQHNIRQLLQAQKQKKSPIGTKE